MAPLAWDIPPNPHADDQDSFWDDVDMRWALPLGDPNHPTTRRTPVDHAPCDGPDCEHVICCCRQPVECPGTTVQACTHHSLLCEECAPVECVDCRINRQDGAA